MICDAIVTKIMVIMFTLDLFYNVRCETADYTGTPSLISYWSPLGVEGSRWSGLSAPYS